jgi:O-antigen/teichoic acid export membrane protein
VLARYFSSEEFGLWSMLMSLNGILITGFDLGFGNALRNRLAVLSARDQAAGREGQEYFFSIFYWFMFTALILTGLFLVLKPAIPWQNLFNSTAPGLTQAGASLMIVGACLLVFNIAFNLYSAGFFGYQESHWNALLGGFSKLALLGVVLLLVAGKGSFYAVNVSFFLVTLVSSAVSFQVFLSVRRWRWRRIPFADIYKRVKELWGKSAQFALLQIFATFLLNADYFVVSKVLGLETVGDYFLIKRLYLVIASFHFAILLPVWSAYTESLAARDVEWVGRSLRKTIFYTLILFGGGILFMSAEGNFILRLWTGKQVPSASLFVWLGIWGLIYGWINCFSVFLNGTGHLKWQVILLAVAAVAFVPLALVLGEAYGAEGICLALILASLPVALVIPVQSIGILKNYRNGKIPIPRNI